MKDRDVLNFYDRHVAGTDSVRGRSRPISDGIAQAMEELGSLAFGAQFAEVPAPGLAAELKRLTDRTAVKFELLAFAFDTNSGNPPAHHDDTHGFWRDLVRGGMSKPGRQAELRRSHLTPQDFGFSVHACHLCAAVLRVHVTSPWARAQGDPPWHVWWATCMALRRGRACMARLAGSPAACMRAL